MNGQCSGRQTGWLTGRLAGGVGCGPFGLCGVLCCGVVLCCAVLCCVLSALLTLGLLVLSVCVSVCMLCAGLCCALKAALWVLSLADWLVGWRQRIRKLADVGRQMLASVRPCYSPAL